jgi:hypothetical protein
VAEPGDVADARRLTALWRCPFEQRAAVVLTVYAQADEAEAARLIGCSTRQVAALRQPVVADRAGWRAALERAAQVVDTPDGWTERVDAVAQEVRGRRRRRQAATVSAVAAVALALAGASLLRPGGTGTGAAESAATLSGPLARNRGAGDGRPEGAVPTGPVTRPPISVNTMPAGAPLRVPYVVAGRGATMSVVMPDGQRWQASGQVVRLSTAGAGGVVALVTPPWPNLDQMTLLYRAGDGQQRVLASGLITGFVVAADGSRVAWASATGTPGRYELTVAALPSATVVARTDALPSPAAPHGGLPNVAGFLGSDVVLDYALDDRTDPDPYRWSTSTGQIHLLLGAQTARTIGRLRGLTAGGLALLSQQGARPTRDCVHALRLSDPNAPPRWSLCGLATADMNVSPDGTEVLTVSNGSELALRDARTGRLLARVRSLDRRYVWMSFDTWEPDGSMVIDLSQVGTETQMRCAPDLRRCERVPRPSGQLVQGVAAAAGTPVSAS